MEEGWVCGVRVDLTTREPKKEKSVGRRSFAGWRLAETGEIQSSDAPVSPACMGASACVCGMEGMGRQDTQQSVGEGDETSWPR